jgi:hypothetical protein
MPSRQESTYCREDESIEMAQKSASNTDNDTDESAKSETITGPAYALSQGVEPHPTTEDPSNSFPQDINNIITKLRITVDHIDSPRNYARDLIHELARQLDERKLCERGRISIKIKEILEDKIHAGKVTERWIRKCLPPEYKREYAKDKRELSSLSEKKPGTESPLEQTITVGSNGQQTIYNEHDTQEPADTSAESVTSNQQSNPAKLQKSDWNPDPKTGTESIPEQVTTEQSNTTSNEASEILKIEYSLPYQYVQQYMAAEYKEGKSKVWFSIEINVKSKKVASARTGRISEAN